MTKSELLEYLVNNYHEDEAELKEMSKAERMERLQEYKDGSGMFQNGRDYDAENEDRF